MDEASSSASSSEARHKRRLEGSARGPLAGARAVLAAAQRSAASTAPKPKRGSCEARLTALFGSIAPEAPPSRVAAGRSGAASHAARVDDVFGSLSHELRRASPPPSKPPPGARPPRGRRPPPPKPGFDVVELGGVRSAGAERAAAFNFLDELRARREAEAAAAAGDDGGGAAADAAPPRRPTFKKRRRPADGAGAAKRLRPAVALSHLADGGDGESPPP